MMSQVTAMNQCHSIQCHSVCPYKLCVTSLGMQFVVCLFESWQTRSVATVVSQRKAKKKVQRKSQQSRLTRRPSLRARLPADGETPRLAGVHESQRKEPQQLGGNVASYSDLCLSIDCSDSKCVLYAFVNVV